MFSILNFNKNVLSSAVSAALLVTVSQITLAQESTETVPSVTDTKMEQVLVSATRFEVEGINTAANISVVTAQDIANSGASNVLDVLRGQAGIQVRDSLGTGNSGTISMRGFGGNASSNTLILVDGRKLNNPTLEGPALGSIALKDVERIEIINGSASVLFGEQAVAGVINIITYRPQAGEVQGWIEASRGTDDLERYQTQFSQGFGNGLSFNASAEERRENGYRDNNEASYTNYFASVRLDKTWGSVFVEQQKIEDRLNLANSLSEQDVEIDRRKSNVIDAFNDTNTDVFRTGVDIKIIEDIRFLAEFTDRDSDTIGDFGDTGFGTFAFSKDTRVKSFTPRVVGKFSTTYGDTLVTLGYDNITSFYQTSFGSDAEQEIEAIYGQLIVPVMKDLTFSVGYRDSEAEDSNLASNAKNTENADALELGLSYQVSSQVRLFARSAEGFRFGNIDENAGTLSGVNFLKPQTSKSLEAGIDVLLGDSNITVTVFDLDLEDEIFYDAIIPNASGFFNSTLGFKAGANINLDSSNRRGATIEVDYPLTDKLTLSSNFSYVDAELTSGSYQGNKVPYVAEYSGNVSGVYFMNSSWAFYLSGNYTGSRYKSGDEANDSSQISAQWLWYANAKYTLDQWTANFRVNNLTGEEVAGFQSTRGLFPAAEREVEVSVSYAF